MEETLCYMGNSIKPTMQYFDSPLLTSNTEVDDDLKVIVEFPFHHDIPGLVMIQYNQLSDQVNVIGSCIHGLYKPGIMGSIYFMKFDNTNAELFIALTTDEGKTVIDAIDAMKDTWLINCIVQHSRLGANYSKSYPHTKQETHELFQKLDKLRLIRDVLYE